MWVRNQDKDMIVDVNSLCIDFDCSEREFVIKGFEKTCCRGEWCNLGFYSNRTNAEKALTVVCEKFESEFIIQMPQDAEV